MQIRYYHFFFDDNPLTLPFLIKQPIAQTTFHAASMNTIQTKYISNDDYESEMKYLGHVW